ncbi:MAG TPA: hypothetical protein VFU49_07955 [Ktedonobacteraceae bacterium]|nr:hypothetical protein [Ktedonobacteraceae bacterium]
MPERRRLATHTRDGAPWGRVGESQPHVRVEITVERWLRRAAPREHVVLPST